MTSNQTPLSGKRVALTGAFGALGRGVAKLLIERGARVALIDRAPAEADAVGGPSAVLLGGLDLASEAGARDALGRAAAALGGLDGLVNIAGGFRWETIDGGKVETWDLLYAMNLRTALLASQAALPHLRAQGRGRIVNIGAAAALRADLGMGAYAASKAGVASLTEALAEEFKDKGITVNAVLPSIIDTPANRADMPGADASRWVSPSELAEVIAFLLQDAASGVTGASIPVRGRV